MTTQRINVDLVPGTSSPSVQVSQGDHELRTIVVTLLNEGKKNVTIPAGASVEVRGTKPSGKGFSYDCPFSGDEVTVKVKDQMTAEKGRVPCEIVVELNGHAIGSSNFDMLVEASALQPGTVASSDTFASLVKKVVVNTEGNLFTNALKGYASGASIQVDDVSPLEHSPVVRVHGKNLIPYPYRNTTLTIGGVTFTDDGSGGISMNGTSTGGCNFFFTGYTFTLKKGKKYTFSVGGDFSATAGVDFWIYSTTLQKGPWMNAAAAKATTFIADSNYIDAAIYCVIGKGTQVTGSMYPMVEESDTATAYEPWVDPTTFKVTDGKGNTFTPNTDGTVEGVTSTSPTMTLSLDKEGATIDVEYNRDLTAAIERIEAALFN